MTHHAFYRELTRERHAHLVSEAKLGRLTKVAKGEPDSALSLAEGRNAAAGLVFAWLRRRRALARPAAVFPAQP